MLRYYEQARDLSIVLLERWPVQYKFKDWTNHRTTNPGTHVTHEQKQARAKEIAHWLSDNAHWHSHHRMIGIETLKKAKLEIDDFGIDRDLQKAVRNCNDALTDIITRTQRRNFPYSRHIN